MQNHPISLLKMMANFVYYVPVFPEFKNLDYNYFKSFLGQNVLESHLSIEKHYVFGNLTLKLQPIASVCHAKSSNFFTENNAELCWLYACFSRI